MPNNFQQLSWIGQSVRLESFTREGIESDWSNEGIRWDWSNFKPLVRTIPAGQNGSLDATAVDQGNVGPEGLVLKDSVVLPPRHTPGTATSKLRTKQIWEGTVVQCEAGSFSARISDRTNPANPDEMAEFEIEEVAPDDQQLINPGATFYWTIGTERTPAGQVRNIAVVNFRRLPRWTRSSFRKAERRAQDVLALFNQE